jgi:mono/diheme cytochrome c family protein
MRPRTAVAATIAAVALAVASGCAQDQENETAVVAADSVALAAALITPEMFDTISWVADSAAVSRGAVVWSYSCRKCHGNSGAGDGGWVQNGDTLRPPSFLAADWQYAGDRGALREQIYTGTNEGMPHWGLAGLKPRDIDAVSLYITRVLRP